MKMTLRPAVSYNDPMSAGLGYSLAIETSAASGEVVLAEGERIVEVIALSDQRRHAAELMPAIDEACRRREVSPGSIEEIYVSIGPGSFTGLRVGVTTAKTISFVTSAPVVGVPTLQVVAANAPQGCDRVAVMLNAKGGRWFTSVFEGGRAVFEASLMTPEQLRAVYEGEVICDSPPDGVYDGSAGLRFLEAELAAPRAELVWRIGRAMARHGQFTDAMKLAPLYVRLPEAQERWENRKSKTED
jgi:tRNA threonylcarbamoyladenosine biosynthesis protein TsaB